MPAWASGFSASACSASSRTAGLTLADAKRLCDGYRIVNKQKDKADRGAAIPYRRKPKSREFEFLLVKTSDAKHWTFPKGRFADGKDETWADTAKREAKEEGGVKGRLDGKRLIEYQYPRISGKPHLVAAFLLEVKKTRLRRKGKDAERETTWCSADDAVAQLSEGREPKYEKEVARIFQKAVRRLGGGKLDEDPAHGGEAETVGESR